MEIREVPIVVIEEVNAFLEEMKAFLEEMKMAEAEENRPHARSWCQKSGHSGALISEFII